MNGSAGFPLPDLQPVPLARGEQAMPDPIPGSRGMAIVVHDDWLYMVGNIASPVGTDDLFIQRYTLDGVKDDQFAMTVDTGLFDRETEGPSERSAENAENKLDYDIYARATDSGLLVAKYSTRDSSTQESQFYLGGWSWEGQAFPDNGLRSFPDLISIAPGIELRAGRFYLSGTDQNGIPIVKQGILQPAPLP